MSNVVPFRPKDQAYNPMTSPVLYAMQILQSHGCNVDIDTFKRVDKYVGEGIDGSSPVTDIQSLQRLCNLNGFCIVINGTSDKIIAYMPGEP